ncbi:MAG: hypothetical protein NT01SARS_0389 [SAR86 cluster bacterium SAR86A]|uniref:Uncharacterized protein n=1 Tax=SAR86 cluster bacterium SAR86A TaxID=1123866 RepID=J4KS13_9GAMM|nr:MAG: hypothetical protein NT01SARS_0389 [SAR86 cluster bacterium SAR86A]
MGFMIIPWIRSLLDYSAIVEILITTAIIIPMYAVLTRLMKNFLN